MFRMRIGTVLPGLIVIYSLASCNGSNTAPATHAPDTEAAQPATSAEDRGRVLYQEKCAACHGLNGDAQSNSAANLPHSVLDSLAITQTIKDGRGTMPMFKDAIADSDIGHLAVYVKGMRK